MTHTLVTFHAHPDDEALLTAGVMAKASTEGHRVVLVVATRGELGMVASGYLDGEELGERRVAEQERAAQILGVHRLEFLDYADSGLEDDGRGYGERGAPRGGRFAEADIDTAAGQLAEILRSEGADVVTIYDRNGGYHHPDHLRVHDVGMRAAELAGTPVVLEATINRELMKSGVDIAKSLGHELPPELSPDAFDDWFLPYDEITHAVDVTAFLDRKRAAMQAHASQATGDEGPRSMELFLSLPAEYYALAFGTEWFVDRGLKPGATDGGLLADVFSGL